MRLMFASGTVAQRTLAVELFDMSQTLSRKSFLQAPAIGGKANRRRLYMHNAPHAVLAVIFWVIMTGTS